ncbi:hypothetical protein STENM223S_03270 [Streptomyces tendae]
MAAHSVPTKNPPKFEMGSDSTPRKTATHPAKNLMIGWNHHQVKANLTAFFRTEAEQGGAGDPDLLARQLSLVFDGASARAGIQADNLTGLVAPTVTTLLDAAGVR